MQNKHFGKFSEYVDRHAGTLFIFPAVLTILAFAIFPLIISAYLTTVKFKLAPGGFELIYVGMRNFRKLFFGSQQFHLLGTFSSFGIIEWVILLLVISLITFGFYKYFSGGKITIVGIFGRVVSATLAISLLVLVLATIFGGYPGSLVVTLFYVVIGVSVQFAIGLGLAILCAQNIKGRNFFRITFFIPLMVTPVGIAYMFRMLADMQQGPLAVIWRQMGFSEFAWASDPWSARIVVLVGDTWQWVPFMFIVLLAAIENMPRDQVEAAKIDGAESWQIFRDITWPSIAPVAATIILIRLIEAFKIIDLPNILTSGGPGIATESLTLHSFIAWRTQDLGGSAAVGYTLLFVSTITCISFFNFIGTKTRKLES